MAIANQLGNPSTVFEATGLFFADALSAVPAAIHAGGAILLTNGTTQAPETAAYLARPQRGYPLCDRGTPRRLRRRPDRDPGLRPRPVRDLRRGGHQVLPHAAVYGAATGLNYPDALVAGVYMATGGRLGPVLLVNTNTPLPASISAYLNTLAVGTPGYVFGGPVAVAEPSVDQALQAAVG